MANGLKVIIKKLEIIAKKTTNKLDDTFVQAMEGMIITPRVVGENIGLHPVAVIFAVLLGAELFGLVGMILGVPAVAILNVLFTRGILQYKNSPLYADQ